MSIFKARSESRFSKYLRASFNALKVGIPMLMLAGYATAQLNYSYENQAQAKYECELDARNLTEGSNGEITASCSPQTGYFAGYHRWYELTRSTGLDLTLFLYPDDRIENCRLGQYVVEGTCTSLVPENPLNSCRIDGVATPNPIFLTSAEKYRSEPDWTDSGPAALSVVRTYRSNWGSDTSRPDVGLGQVWTHNHATTLKATPSSSPTAVAITSPEGYLRTFVKAVGSSTWTATNGADVLTEAGGAWLYRRADDDAVLAFTADGKLQTRTERGGFTYTYAYDGSGRLASVSNGFGRSMVFAYAGGKLATVTLPDARVIGYTYDSVGRLVTVLYPDGKSRGFLYENASFPQALTGILDESGVRWGTFAYDSDGRAISTELAGGVNRYQVSYPYTGAATVIDPLNTTRNYSYATAAGKLAVTSGSLPSGEGEADASSREQDANGLITSQTDFKGARTEYVWDVARRLPTSVTEAVGTPEARTVTTQWHASMAVPTLVTESGKTTAYTWDAQGRMLTRSVTDTLVTPNTTKTWTWTYSAQGLVATEQAPNGAVTSYTYDTKGNVLTATNALGHVTGYAYDNANRLVSQSEPNGLVTTYAWDARDRLLGQTVGSGLSGAQTTTLTYNPTRHPGHAHAAHRPGPELHLRQCPPPHGLEQQPRRIGHLHPGRHGQPGGPADQELGRCGGLEQRHQRHGAVAVGLLGVWRG